MAEESSTESNNGVFTSVFDESEDVSDLSSVPGVDAKCLSSRGEPRGSEVTSVLDRAVAALENRTDNILEHSLTSENGTTYLPSEQKLVLETVNQDCSPQRWTIPVQDPIASREYNDQATIKTRDFSELRAMFSQTGAIEDITPPRQSTTSLDLSTANKGTLDLDSIDMEHDEVVCNEMHSEGDSMVARMKRSFETTDNSSTSSIKKRGNEQTKPVSFGLGGYVTRDSSVNISHDPSRTDQIKKNMFENMFSKNESLNTSITDSPVVETLESNKQSPKKEEILATTGNPSDSPKNISFDISFDDQISKRISPKTMPKPPRGKLVDKNTTKSCASENDAIKHVEREEILDSHKESKDSPKNENILGKRSCSFEVSLEDDSPKKPNSRDRLNKLLVKKPSRTDRPSGEKIAVSRGTESPVDGEDELTKYTQHETVKQPMTSSPKDQALYESATCFDVSLDKLMATETTKEHILTTEDKERAEQDEVKKTTRGISFDVCFGEDSLEKPKLNQKSKLTTKHIRLKMTKPKGQKNTQNKIKTDETTNVTSSVSANVLPGLITRSFGEANERNTYTLDEVSNTLQSACERGLTLEDALDDLAKQQEPKDLVGSGMVTSESSVRDEVVHTKRGTYSLDAVATCLVSAADKGLTVADALDSLANSEEKIKGGITQDYVQNPNTEDTNVNRGTYDFNDVSKTIDNEKDKGNSLEEALIKLLDEVESVVKETQKKGNRGTYDLKDVSEVVQEASDLGIPVEKTLKKIAKIGTNDNSTNNIQTTTTVNERNTVPGEYLVDFGKLNPHTGLSAGKRRTSGRRKQNIEKHLEPKHKESSALSKINSTESIKLEETPPSRNTYTLDEVAESLELAKSKGIPIVEALSIISPAIAAEGLETPGSRGTYPLEEVAQSLETAREKGLPVVMALENLGLHGGVSLKGPAEVAVHRRQGKLINRKTYALASPLETIGEEKQLRLFDGTSRKLLPQTQVYSKDLQPLMYDDPENLPPSGQNVVQTLDLLTSACEALLKTTSKKRESYKTDEERLTNPQASSEENRGLRQQFKAVSRDSGISFPSGASERSTYSLDDVSESLEGAAKKGIPVIEALGSLTTKEPVTKYRIPRALRKAGSKSESSLVRNTTALDETSRQTYSLDDVSNSMEDATAKGIPVIAALDELTNSLAKFSATRPSPGRPLKKPDRPSITRKREAARKERANVRSELGREVSKQSGMSFPISYPPALRNSYSLDDVASAFEKAYQTGIPFQNVLEGMYQEDNNVTSLPSEDGGITRSTGSLRMEKHDLQSTTACEDCDRKSQSASSLTKTNAFSIPVVSDSSLDRKTSSPPRKSSTSSEGSLSYSSSYGSDISINRDSSSTEELPHVSKVSSVRKQRRQSNGPFQLKMGNRRNSPAHLRKPSTSSLQGESIESLTSRDSETSESSQSKRGTYDLKKVGEELDSFKIQGIPIVKGLDKITTDMSVISKAGNEKSKTIQVSPKRGTYSLEDVSQQLDSENTKCDSVIQALDKVSSNPELSSMSFLNGRQIHRDSQSVGDLSEPSVTKDKTRNTFTLDHVDVSIADAASRGVPVVEALNKLSHGKTTAIPDKREAGKPDHKTDSVPKGQRLEQDAFFIEYIPSKTEEAPKRKVENGARAVEVEDEYELKHRDLDKYPTRDSCTILESQKIEPRPSQSDLQVLDHSSLVEQTSSQNESAAHIETSLQGSSSETQMSHDQTENEVLPESSSNQASMTSRSRPRWQRSGSYVEALESFEELLATDQVSSSYELDSIPVKESNYVNGKYDTMYPESASGAAETSPRGRSTWRPSASVLDKILNLMDDHEEHGMSIADALEKAAELSEQQGEPHDSIINDAKAADGLKCSGKQRVSEQEDLERDDGRIGQVGTKFPSFGNQEDQLPGYQVESRAHHITANPQDKVPLQQDFENNGLHESTPPRQCQKVNNPSVPPTVVGFASSSSSDVGCHGQLADNEMNEDEDPSSKNVFSIFIGDESEPIKEGLTPEQQKKRDRFLRNRQKKMEEEKARRESENERKRQQQEIQTPKRVRHFNQSEEQPSRPPIRECRSPPRIIKSSGKSNRKMITNALCHACLSGAVNNDNRERCLQAMSESQGSHFIILLKDGLRFRGLFVYSTENEQAYKIYGTGPKIISSNMVDCVYKYSSGSKEFIKIPSKSLSISVDGVAINKVYWQSNKPNVLSKTQSNLKRLPRPPQR